MMTHTTTTTGANANVVTGSFPAWWIPTIVACSLVCRIFESTKLVGERERGRVRGDIGSLTLVGSISACGSSSVVLLVLLVLVVVVVVVARRYYWRRWPLVVVVEWCTDQSGLPRTRKSVKRSREYTKWVSPLSTAIGIGRV